MDPPFRPTRIFGAETTSTWIIPTPTATSATAATASMTQTSTTIPSPTSTSASANDGPSYYHYDPSEVAAGIFIGLYTISFCLTLFQIIRRRSWVWLVFLFALAMEVAGFAARIVSAGNQTEQGPYAIQFILILIAPVVMAAAIYVLFGRLIFWVVPPAQRTMKLLWAPPRWITAIFVTFDIISLLLQASAGAILTGAEGTPEEIEDQTDQGRMLGIIGVIVQLVAFGFFTLLAVRLQFISRTMDQSYVKANMETWGITRHYSRLLLVINITCLLILIRSCFRLVEFIQGRDGIVHSEEWYLYVLDVVPVALVVIAYHIWFPGQFLKHLGFRRSKEPSDAEANPMKIMTPQSQTQESETRPVEQQTFLAAP